MKIGCICNMNNNFFSLVRYLRDYHFNAELCLLENELPHFHPSADSYDLSFQEYTRDLSWGNYLTFNKTRKKEIEESMAGYDFIIACGSVPAYLNKIGRIVDLFIPYGTDIYEYPFFRIVNPKYQFDYFSFSRNQIKGIQKARIVSMDETNEYAEKIISSIGLSGERYKLGMPMLYAPLYNPGEISNYYDRSQWYKEFSKIRQDNDIIVFHQARHMWKQPQQSKSKGNDALMNEINYKANDKLIRGFAEFVRKTKSVRSCLIMFEYGRDLFESKRLVHDLGINGNVRWFPLTTRKEIMIGLSLSDFGSGEFGNSWLSCGTIYETIAMGKPLFHYREDAQYTTMYEELYPMVNCTNADDITTALEDYIGNKEKYKLIGERARQWFLKYAIEYPLKQYLKILHDE